MSLHISNVYAKKKGIAKKLILTLRAIMISQEVDLVAGDFNGTAWRCRSRENLSTIDEAFADCDLPTPPGRTSLWRPGSIPNNWADVCGFLNLPVPSDAGRLANIARSLSPGKLLALDQMIKAAIMRHGFTLISSIGTTNGPARHTTTETCA